MGHVAQGLSVHDPNPTRDNAAETVASNTSKRPLTAVLKQCILSTRPRSIKPLTL